MLYHKEIQKSLHRVLETGIFYDISLVRFRSGSRPVQQMPMHLSDFDGDAYLTVCVGEILLFLLLLLVVVVVLLACKGSSLTITG